MKTIKLYDTTYDIMTLYRKAKTPAQRARAGYIVKAGQIHNTIFGGAFCFLCNVEKCMNTEEIYEIYSFVDDTTKKQIVHIAQLAIDGELDKFAMSEREIRETIKNLCQCQ